MIAPVPNVMVVLRWRKFLREIRCLSQTGFVKTKKNLTIWLSFLEHKGTSAIAAAVVNKVSVFDWALNASFIICVATIAAVVVIVAAVLFPRNFLEQSSHFKAKKMLTDRNIIRYISTCPDTKPDNISDFTTTLLVQCIGAWIKVSSMLLLLKF